MPYPRYGFPYENHAKHWWIGHEATAGGMRENVSNDLCIGGIGAAIVPEPQKTIPQTTSASGVR